MCDPTALLDLVPSEGLLKRPSMDYNEYTYCYGGGRGGWYGLLLAKGPDIMLRVLTCTLSMDVPEHPLLGPGATTTFKA
ncbi:hypothetical protein M0802_000155 [Mischocyttarus mexicanus]|nr:hypothetical protein M0802_000155 [Mischocyttarus mexicanus]